MKSGTETMTTEEAMRFLGVSRKTLYRYEKQKLLKAKRINSRLLLWSRRHLEKLVKA